MLDQTTGHRNHTAERVVQKGKSAGQGNQLFNPSPFAAPSISLPKGGGAIRGIGENFSAHPVTGTASMTVPITVSPGRSNSPPQLLHSHDSGSGNGPFGLGWSLSLPGITRKTDKGLPSIRMPMNQMSSFSPALKTRPGSDTGRRWLTSQPPQLHARQATARQMPRIFWKQPTHLRRRFLCLTASSSTTGASSPSR